MSCVALSTRRVCDCVYPSPLWRGVHTRRVERGAGGSIFWSGHWFFCNNTSRRPKHQSIIAVFPLHDFYHRILSRSAFASIPCYSCHPRPLNDGHTRSQCPASRGQRLTSSFGWGQPVNQLENMKEIDRKKREKSSLFPLHFERSLPRRLRNIKPWKRSPWQLSQQNGTGTRHGKRDSNVRGRQRKNK